MQLVSDRRYRFPVPPEEVWSAIADTGAYRRWWPWLRAFDAAALTAGQRWRCTVRPPLPYTLRFTIHLDDVEPNRLVTAHVDGDIAGSARVAITSDGDGSAVHLTSTLTPRSRTFGVLATAARPIVRWGHDWVLDTGAGQFRARALAAT